MVTVKPPVLRLLLLASLACRVIVDVVLPSAATLVGLAVTIELATVAVPGILSTIDWISAVVSLSILDALAICEFTSAKLLTSTPVTPALI